MTRHSSIVGGSTAGRLLNCPGSYQATLALPPSADVESEYAAEGTAMHAVMDMLMRARQSDPDVDAYQLAGGMLGATAYDRALTREHLDTMIEPALRALAELERAYGGGFEVLAVERSVIFPGIPGARGTVDLILGNHTTVLHVDWKFGQGVGVHAIDGERVNAQLMFYTAGAMHSARSFYRNKKCLVVAIIQPRAEHPLRHVEISRKEVKWFVEDVQNAVELATGRDPIRQKGEWCRFAPCKINCPLWTEPMLTLAALGPKPEPRTEIVSRETTPYGEYLARAKALVDIAALFGKELDKQLHAYLEDGGTVPGWRLKPKAKQRQWIDEETVRIELEGLGFDTAEIYNYKLVTFQQADATARRLGVKIPDELRVAPPTNETTIATTDDPAPVVDRQTAIEQFAASLKLLDPSQGNSQGTRT